LFVIGNHFLNHSNKSKWPNSSFGDLYNAFSLSRIAS